MWKKALNNCPSAPVANQMQKTPKCGQFWISISPKVINGYYFTDIIIFSYALGSTKCLKQN